MLKRKPTRIELKAEDAQEYEEVARRNAKEQDKDKVQPIVGGFSSQPSARERVGYKKPQ
jgi:hypothetical protein